MSGTGMFPTRSVMDLLSHRTYLRGNQESDPLERKDVMTVQPLVQPDPRRWKALALLCGAFFMVILDTAIVVVALPSIHTDLVFSPSDLQWVLSAYALTCGGLRLLGGRAADLLGRRRVF